MRSVESILKLFPYRGVLTDSVILNDGSIVTGLSYLPIPMDGESIDTLSAQVSKIENLISTFPNNAAVTITMFRTGDVSSFIHIPDNTKQGHIFDFSNILTEYRRSFYYRLANANLVRVDNFRIYVTICPTKAKQPDAITYLGYLTGDKLTPKILKGIQQRRQTAIELILDIQRILHQAGTPETTILSGREIVSDAYLLASGIAPTGGIPENHHNPLYALGTCEIDTTYSRQGYLITGTRFSSVLTMTEPPDIAYEGDIPSIFRRIQGIPSDFWFAVTIEPLDSNEAEKIFRSAAWQGSVFAKAGPKTLAKLGVPLEEEDIQAKIDTRIKAIGEEAELAKEMVARLGTRFALSQATFIVTAKELSKLEENTRIAMREFEQIFRTTVKREALEILPVWLSALPGAGYRGIRKITEPVGIGVRFAPFLGGLYKAGKKPRLPVFTITGSGFMYDPYSLGDGQRHKVVVATSGGGKSVFVNEIILSKLIDDSFYIIVDIGGSYLRTCHLLGGDYFALHTKGARSLSINPMAGIAEAYGAFKSDPDKRGEWAEESAYAVDFLEIILRGERPHLEPEEKGALTEILAILAEDGWNNKYEVTLEHFADLLRQHRKFSRLAHALSPFCEGGPWDGFFNKATGEWIPRNITVFDLDGIDSPQFAQLRSVLFPAIARFTMNVFNKYKDRSKFFIVDEGKTFLDDPASAKFVDFAYQRSRKLGGCCILIVQSPMYLTRSDFGESILANTDEQIFLATKEIGAKDMEQMGLSPEEIEVVKMLETRPREYSMLYFRSKNFGKTRLVLRLPQQEYWLVTTDPEDQLRFAEAFKAEGGDLFRTLERLSA